MSRLPPRSTRTGTSCPYTTLCRSRGADLRARRVRAGVAGQADRRHAAVGHVVLVDVQQVEEQARRAVQPERQRRPDAPALVGHFVAAGDAAVLRHQVDAERIAVAERLVEMLGGGALVVRSDGRRGWEEGLRTY